MQIIMDTEFLQTQKLKNKLKRNTYHLMRVFFISKHVHTIFIDETILIAIKEMRNHEI